MMSRILLAVSMTACVLLSACAGRKSEAPVNYVLVSGGTFRMGTSDDTERSFPDHDVTVSSFYMTKTEVTVADFRKFIEETGYTTFAEIAGKGFAFNKELGVWGLRIDASWKNPGFQQEDTHPVVLVSWMDAVAYANWLSESEGLEPAYGLLGVDAVCRWETDGWRLPTEAEWEYAARGGSVSKGYAYAGSDNPDEVAWYGENSGKTGTCPVAAKQANELGLFDMCGNVSEWCWDWYDEYSAEAQNDPRGPESGYALVFRGKTDFGRIVRGGDWYLNAYALPPTDRSYSDPVKSNSGTGFRLVRPVRE